MACGSEQQKGRASKRGRKKKKLRVHLKEATMAQGAQSLCEGYYKVRGVSGPGGVQSLCEGYYKVRGVSGPGAYRACLEI